MINLATIYGTRVLASEAFPQGAAKNESAEGANDGLYPDKAWVNDIFGFMQAAIKQGAVTISDSGETADASDVLDAILKLASVVKFPTTSGKLLNSGAPTWSIINDDNASSINLQSIAPVTTTSGDETAGDLKIIKEKEYNTTHSFIASMSKELARFGVNIGINSKTGAILCSMASSFGIRALLTYEGNGVWSESEDEGFSSKKTNGNSLTVNNTNSYTGVNVSWDSATIKYIKTNKNWLISQCTNKNNPTLGSGVDVIIDQDNTSNTGVRLRFRANTPISAHFSNSLLTGSFFGITDYSYNSGVLTINHIKRSGRAFISSDNMVNYLINHVSDTKIEVRAVNYSGVQLISEFSFNFNLVIHEGGADFVEPPVGTTISISNGTGARPQDADTIRAGINIFGVGEVPL